MIDLQKCAEYRLLTTAEVAEALGISAYRVRKLVAAGELPYIDGFRHFFFTVAAVRAFVDRGRGAATPAVEMSSQAAR